MKVFPLGRILSYLAYKYILRINGVAQCCHYLVVVIGQFDLDNSLCGRHRQQIDILKTAIYLCCFLSILPLLEQSAECVAVKCITRGGIGHHYLPVTLQIQILHVHTTSVPPVNHVQVIQINPRLLAVA